MAALQGPVIGTDLKHLKIRSKGWSKVGCKITTSVHSLNSFLSENCGISWKQSQEGEGPKELKWGHIDRFGWNCKPELSILLNIPGQEKQSLLHCQMTLVFHCLRSCNDLKNQGSYLPRGCWSSLGLPLILLVPSDL